jgi:AcrR family transcriptional regulator
MITGQSEAFPMSVTPVQSSSGAPEPTNGTAEAIRSAAIALFAHRGYEATTMNGIGRSVGIRGSAIYNHVPSKQELLREIIFSAMYELIHDVRCAIEEADGIPDRLRRGFAEHVLYHARRRLEFSVGNREIPSLEEPAHTQIIELRHGYVRMFEEIIKAGARDGVFDVTSTLIATHAILQAGMGVAVWFDPNGAMTAEEVSEFYGELALRVVGYRR